MEPIDLISSDEDLPNVVTNGVIRRLSNDSSASTIILDLDDKENINGQDVAVGCDDEIVVLSGSSSKSLKEINWHAAPSAKVTARKRYSSASSESTINLNLNDQDLIYDELMLINKEVVNVECEEVTSLRNGSDASTATSASSGYHSSGSQQKTREKSVGNAKEKTRKKPSSVERITKKQKLAEERAARQAANEVNKIYKPGECMKYMRICVHPSLASEWYMSEVRREVEGAGAAVETTGDLCHERVVLWTRGRGGRTLTGQGGQMALSDTKDPCNRAILVFTAEEIAPLIAERGLARHVGTIKQMTGCEMTLAVFGVKDYFKSGSKKKKQAQNMNQIEMEMAFTDLLVTSSVDVHIADSPSELALFITHMTKAIAEQPHKLAKRAVDEQADFYMRGDNKNCVKVDKDGNGLSRLWQQMIAVLPHSSLEVSRAVCSNYKSPLQLYEALQSPNGVLSLADTGIDRANLPGARLRRLGPEFARKLHVLFTADDGDTLVE